MPNIVFTLQAALPGAVEFGALTLAGQGGAPTTGASISSGNDSGHWTITGGKVVPTAQAVTDGYNAAPYSLTFDDASTMTITCPADVRHVATDAELVTAITAASGAGALAGKTIRIRGGNYADPYAYGRYNGYTSMAVFEAADVNDKPIFAGWQAIGDGGPIGGNITLRNLKFYHNPSDLNARFVWGAPGGNDNVVFLKTSQPTVVEDCEFYGNFTQMGGGGAKGPGQRSGWTALQVDGSNHTIRRNIFRNMDSLATVGLKTDDSVFEDNEIHTVFNDFLNVGSCNNLVIRNNRFYDPAGCGAINYHCDFFQYSEGSGVMTNITVEGNIFALASGDPKQLPYPFDGFMNTVDLGVNTTLGASHMSRIIRPTTSGLTFTMPDPASYPQETVYFGNISTEAGFTLTGTIEGGDVVVDSSVHRATYGLFSDGTTWKKARLGIGKCTEILASRTLTSQHSGHVFLVDASAGNITITLPNTSGMSQIGFIREDDSANTVTISAASGQTITRLASATLTKTLGSLQSIRLAPSGSTWNMTFANSATGQGIFGNQYTYSNITTRGNIIVSRSSWHYRLESSAGLSNWSGYHRVYNNTFLNPISVDTNSDGLINDEDGWHPAPGFNTGAVGYNCASGAANADAYCIRNVISGSYSSENGSNPYLATGGADENIVLGFNASNGATAKAAMDAIMATPMDGYLPTTIAEVIAIADNIDEGTRGASYYWDFSTKAKRVGATEPTIP